MDDHMRLKVKYSVYVVLLSFLLFLPATFIVGFAYGFFGVTFGFIQPPQYNVTISHQANSVTSTTTTSVGAGVIAALNFAGLILALLISYFVLEKSYRHSRMLLDQAEVGQQMQSSKKR